MSKLTEFQLGIGRDHEGRLISDIWAFDSFTLELDHTYIQWLFPIETSSKFNLHAPVLTPDDRKLFSEKMQENQRRSLAVMLDFFGIKHSSQGFLPVHGINPREYIWLKRGGHNHLRISRIIRSLTLCGQPHLASEFMVAMIDIAERYGAVSDSSRQYWREAIVI